MTNPYYAPTRPPRKGLGGWSIAGLALAGSLIVGIPVAMAGTDPAAAPVPITSTAPTTEAPTTGPSTEAPTQVPEPDKEGDEDDPVGQPESKPEGTRAQREALEAAQNYVDSLPFSKKGLMDQLTSPYGSDFKKADAAWAVKRVDVDYNAEAVEAAESYLDSGSFSKQSLHDQLTSEYGSQFTEAQADHAIKQVYR